jgi:zinc protease
LPRNTIWPWLELPPIPLHLLATMNIFHFSHLGRVLAWVSFSLVASCTSAYAKKTAPDALAALNSPKALQQALPISPKLKVGTLPNGLTYYIQKNARPEKKVELRLVVKAGSILEDEDQQGLAHLTEHMAFNGSTHFKKHELISYLQSIGVKFGADLNAYTSFDETVYILPIPTDKPGNLATGMKVLQDWAGGLTLNDADIDKEREIVLEELRRGKGADDRMSKQLYPKLFNGSQYAKRLPIGTEEILKSFKPEAVQRFYRDWYRPNLMAVVAVGDLDPKQIETMIQQHFGKLSNPANERPRTYATIPARAESEALVLTDKEASSNSVLLRYPVQSFQDSQTLGQYRAKMVEDLVGQMLGQRLHELTQQANPPFGYASSGVSKLARGYRSFTAHVAIGRQGSAPAITALLQENQRARQFGFSHNELVRAKKFMVRSLEQAWQERDKTESATFADETIRHFLEQEPVPGIVNEYHYVKHFSKTITLAEVNQVARKLIPHQQPKLVAYMGSDKSEALIPKPEELLAQVAAAEQSRVDVRVEKAVAKSLVDSHPTPGRIIAESVNQALGTTEWQLSNGAKVILKPSNFKNDQILFEGIRVGGVALFPDADLVNARYASHVAAQMGVKDFSPTDLGKILAGKSVNVELHLGDNHDHVSGFAGSKDLETLLQLIHLKFTQPRKDEALFQGWVNKAQDHYKDSLAAPEAQLYMQQMKALYGDHPRADTIPTPAEIGKIRLDRAMEIHRQRFSSAKDFTFIFVGSFDPAKLKPLLATWLASLPGDPVDTRMLDVAPHPVRGVVRQEVRAGSEAKAVATLYFGGPSPYAQIEITRLLALIEVLNLKISDVLREKLTLIYSGSLHGDLQKHPYPHYRINTQLTCAPENTEKVINALMGEIEKIKTVGPELADLNKVKQNWLTSYRNNMRDNSYWMTRLQNAVTNQLDPALLLHYESRVKGLSQSDIQQAAQRYFDMNNQVQVVLKPKTDN